MCDLCERSSEQGKQGIAALVLRRMFGLRWIQVRLSVCLKRLCSGSRNSCSCFRPRQNAAVGRGSGVVPLGEFGWLLETGHVS